MLTRKGIMDACSQVDLRLWKEGHYRSRASAEAARICQDQLVKHACVHMVEKLLKLLLRETCSELDIENISSLYPNTMAFTQ